MQQSDNSPGLLAFACLLWLALGLLPLGSQAAAVVQVHEEVTAVSSNFLLLIDPERQLTIEDVLAQDAQNQFLPVSSRSLNFGYSEANYWIKLVLNNATTQDDWYLIAESPYMELTAWRDTGTRGSIASAVVMLHHPDALPLYLPAGQTTTYYLRAHTPYLADLQFRIMSQSRLEDRSHRKLVLVAIVTGCFLAMILYNCFLYLSLRDRNYLYYLLFALVNSQLNLLAGQFPEGIDRFLGLDWWTLLPFYVPLAPMTALIFARSFLQTRVNAPQLDRLLRLYMGGLVLLGLAPVLLPRTSVLNFGHFYFLSGILLLLYAGYHSLRLGFRPAAYFLAGVGTFLIGMFVLLSKAAGFLPSNIYTCNMHLVGHAAEMLLMSLALGGRIKLLETAKAKAEVTAQVKSRLIRVISHDIVTPLTVVKVTGYWLKKEHPADQRVERIVRASAIIEDIIGFVRKSESVENGNSMELAPVELKRVFEELAFLFHDRAMEKRIRIQFDLKDPSLTVRAEPVSLGNEVLGNLLSNAIKFSYPDSVIQITAVGLPSKKVMITIGDQGIGMDGSSLASLFDPTRKQSRQGTQGEKGIGFGMPLAKAYIDAYGGLIEVESSAAQNDQVRTGTTIRIILDQLPPESLDAQDRGSLDDDESGFNGPP